MGKKREPKPNYRGAYFALRRAVIDVRDARITEVNELTPPNKSPGIHEWAAWARDLDMGNPIVGPRLRRLFGILNDIERQVDEDNS